MGAGGGGRPATLSKLFDFWNNFKDRCGCVLETRGVLMEKDKAVVV